MSLTRLPSPMIEPLPDRAFAPGWEPRAGSRPAQSARVSFFDMAAKIRFAEAAVLLAIVNAAVAQLILFGL